MVKPHAPSSFCHPICHFINGERLHYLLIKVRHRLFDAGKRVGEVLAEKSLGVAASSCAYFIFGQSDMIVRVWATETHLEGLLNALRNKVPEIEEIETILIQRMLTWYQFEIERKDNWDGDLDVDHVVQIANHRISDNLKYVVSKRRRYAATRFFIFIEESFTKRSDIYRRLKDDIVGGKPELLAGLDRVSIYRYVTRDYLGVLLKGEIRKPERVTARLLEFAEAMKQYAVKTTTFICSPHAVKNDENELNPRLRESAFAARQREIFYNLIRTHDCNKHTIREYGGDASLKMAERFQEIGASLLEEVFVTHRRWWGMVDDLTLLHKWIAFGDAEKVMQKLRQRFIILERDLSDILGPSFEILARDEWQLIRSRTTNRFKIPAEIANGICDSIRKELRVETHLTLGSVPACIRSLVKRCLALQDETRPLLEEFAKRLEAGAQDRNLLMHGRIETSEFVRSNEENSHWAWEKYIENFLKVSLMFPRVRPLLESLSEHFVVKSSEPKLEE